MSTDSNVQTETVEDTVTRVDTPAPKQGDEDDNKLVTREDLDKQDDADVKPSLWSDADLLAKLRAEMQVLSKVRIPVEQLPEGVILKAMAEVLAELDWTDYASFNKMIKRILTGPPKSVPFAVKTRNQRTGKMDFWLIRVFVPIAGANSEYEFGGKKYNKRDVLMSHQFCDYLRDFCRTQLKDEAQFWTFTGSYRNKQHLDMAKLNQDDMAALRQMGETNPNNLVMFQFKKKVPEVYVGGLRKQVEGDVA
jgi:hypothetical protein